MCVSVCVRQTDRQTDSLWERIAWDLCVTAFASLSVQHTLRGGLAVEWCV